jgi:large subunit ribosomal protein L24
MHTRQKLVSAHLDPKLRKSFNRRSLPIHKGDEVKVMRGSKKGLKGKVSEVDLSSMKVYIEGQLRESVTGNKILVPFNPSNLMITDTAVDDKYRRKMVERKGPVKVEKPKEEKKEEKPKAEKKAAKEAKK